MYTITIIPTTSNAQHGFLTYFSSTPIKQGDLVEGLYGKSTVQGIAINVSPVKDTKTILKSSDFAMRKITRIIQKNFLETETIDMLLKYSAEYFIPIGKLFSYIFPRWYFNQNVIKTKTSNLDAKIECIQENISHRENAYIEIIKKNTLKNQSTWIIAPTLERVANLKILLQNNSLKIISITSKTKNPQEILDAVNNKKPSIFITTPGQMGIFLAINIHTIIVESESNNSYRIGKLPQCDSRDIITKLFQRKVTRIIFGDSLLSFKTYIKYYTSSKNIVFQKPLSFKIVTKKDPKKDSIFINNEMETLFEKAVKEHKRILLVTQKSGIAAKVLCNDCKKYVTCKKCSNPISLKFSTKNIPIFFCSVCSKEYNSLVSCNYCQSWNLIPLGIGTDSVRSYIEKKYAYTVTQIDPNTTSTQNKIKKVISENKNSLFLTTEYGLPFLSDSFDICISISFDSFLYSGSYNIEDKTYRLLLLLSSLSKDVYFQTRLNDYSFLLEMRDDQKSWYQNQLDTRKLLVLPPYTKEYLIKFRNKKNHVLKENIENMLTENSIIYKKNIDTIIFFIDDKKEILIREYLLPQMYNPTIEIEVK